MHLAWHWRRCMNKYHNRKVTVNGITFDSQKEADRYLELMLLQKSTG